MDQKNKEKALKENKTYLELKDLEDLQWKLIKNKNQDKKEVQQIKSYKTKQYQHQKKQMGKLNSGINLL